MNDRRKSENGDEINCDVPVTWSNDMPAVRLLRNLFVALGSLCCYLILRGMWRGIVSCAARGSPIVGLLK